MAILTAAWMTTSVSAQQISGEYVVGSQVISDVAVGESAGADAYPSYPVEGSTVGEEKLNTSTVVMSKRTPVVASSVDPGRLGYLVHGGEQGPHIPKRYAQPDLFYNYYSNVEPSQRGDVPFAGPRSAVCGQHVDSLPTVHASQLLVPAHGPLSQSLRLWSRYQSHQSKLSCRAKQYAQTLYNVFRIAR
ncbi:MAG: hypothetical protein R3C05_04915 [Pirellulaceae bacterium]